MNNDKKSIIGAFLFSAVLLFIMLIIPQTIGLGKSGFEVSEILNQFFFYGISIGFLVGILLYYVVEVLIKKGDATYGNNLGFTSQGDEPSLPFFKRFSTLQLFFIFFILFSFLGLFSSLNKNQLKSFSP